ncbi:MAG: metallophosphoesterase [Hyphomicrobiaceae bacterium]
MRCHYLSDLHLEAQDFVRPLPGGDMLIIAGDLCQARALDPARQDLYSIEQRTRVMRFLDKARDRFRHVLLVAGNHEHYDGIFEDTVTMLRAELAGVTVLDDEAVEIGGVRFFGTTLWSGFEGGSQAVLDGVRKRMGEYFFVRTHAGSALGENSGRPRRFQPEDALAAFRRATAALSAELATSFAGPTVVVSHHAPSRKGLNALFMGNGLDGAYASDLEPLIAGLADVPFWVHGHTHVARRYPIGETMVLSNALGFEARGHAAPGFSTTACFEI